jgi:hypothetical protein
MSNGKLTISLDTRSNLLNNTIPIEVRDSNLVLIDTVRGSRQELSLPEGLYEISAVLSDGRRSSQIAQVRSDRREEVRFGASQVHLPWHSVADSAPRAVPSIKLTEVVCAESERDPAGWRFTPKKRRPSQLPTATFRTPTGKVTVSLPVNPRGHGSLAECVVKVRTTDSGPVFRSCISPERRVASTLEQMLHRNQLSRAGEVAKNARDLLMSKYQDPVGAALGGLVLFRLGLLEPKMDWVRNLARDFAWMPDGKLLLVALIVNDPAEHNTALDLLLTAATQRPMFVDAFSLMLNLLRRWPTQQGAQARRKALSAWAREAAHIDWASVALCTPEEKKERAATKEGKG